MGFKEDLHVHPYITNMNRHSALPPWKRSRFRKLFRPYLVAATGLVALCMIIFLFPGQSAPTWADVLKKMGRSNFVTASVYIRNYPFNKPEMVEYWRGQGNNLRILSNHLVTFASGNQVRTFNLATRTECEEDNVTKSILNLYNYQNSSNHGANYAKTLLLELYDGKAMESTSLLNATNEISDNLLVYDLKHVSAILYLRVWVLRTSMLPVRLYYWNDFGARTDVIFSYSKEQPQGFFDAEKFSKKLKNKKNSAASLMYSGLEDPGGRAIPSPGI